MPTITIAAPGKPYDLVVACFIVFATSVLSVVAPGNPVNWFLAMLSIYFFPGYVISAIIFPGNDLPVSRALFSNRKEIQTQMSLLERLVLSIVVSLIVVSLIGTVLATFGLLDLQSVTSEILLLTFACSGLAYRMRSKLPPERQMKFVIDFNLSRAKLTRGEKVVLLFIILAFTLVVAMLAIGPGFQPDEDRYTIVELTGVGGDLETLPHSITAGSMAALDIAVTNKMNVEMNYNLTIGIGNLSVVTAYDHIDWNNATILQPGFAFSDEFTLPANGFVERTFAFSINVPGEYKITFRLTYENKVQELWLWIVVAE